MAASKNGGGAVAEVANVRMLTVEDILAADDIAEAVIEVPEWGGSVRIRAFSKAVEQRLRTESGGATDFDTDRFEMLLFIEGVVDPKFTVEQLDALKAQTAKLKTRLAHEPGRAEEGSTK